MNLSIGKLSDNTQAWPTRMVRWFFEGDIVKVTYTEKRQYQGVAYDDKHSCVEEIFYSEESACFMLKIKLRDISMYRPLHNFENLAMIESIEVIGNVHDNTELLEVKWENIMNNKFKYVFEDDYNFYYTDNIVYKYFEYTADDSEPRMVGAVKVISVEMTTAMVFNEEEQAVEALYCVCFAVNDSEKKYSIALTKNALTKNDLINKLRFTIVAKKNNPSDAHAWLLYIISGFAM